MIESSPFPKGKGSNVEEAWKYFFVRFSLK